MNMFFSILFTLSLIYSGWTDYGVLKRKHKPIRICYYVISGGVLFLFVMMYFQLPMPMPTRFITYQMAPWIHRVMNE